MEKIHLIGLFTGTAYASFAAHKLVTGDTGTQDAGNHQLEINTNWIKQLAKPAGSALSLTHT
jgi:hypothetical protein